LVAALVVVVQVQVQSRLWSKGEDEVKINVEWVETGVGKVGSVVKFWDFHWLIPVDQIMSASGYVIRSMGIRKGRGPEAEARKGRLCAFAARRGYPVEWFNDERTAAEVFGRQMYITKNRR
jgi:hypothetical protein